MIKPQTLKGFRDFLPPEAMKRQYVIDIIRKTFELYGFEPLETPAIEYEEVLLGKYGEEGDKLMYRFTDKGGRKIALRYDQTVPLARVIGQHQHELNFPFKRYQIQPVWRAENTQRGRYREFLQCDIDTVGVHSLLADAEIIACVLTAARNLGFKHSKMLINDRHQFGNLPPNIVSSIDKLEKIGKESVIAEIVKKGWSKPEAIKYINSFDDNKPLPNVTTVFNHLRDMGFTELSDFQFSSTLARGLDYYTGTIFELIDSDYKSGSLGGGGRYDKLIGKLFGQDIPAVGFAFGFDRLIEAINQSKLLTFQPSRTKVFVTTFKEYRDKSLLLTTSLRDAGINVEISLDINNKLDKQLKYADKKGIPFVVILGPEEIRQNKIKLKNMKTREELLLNEQELIKKVLNSY